METIEDVLMATTVMEHSRFFCYMAKQIESHKGITNIRTAEKVMPYHISPNGSAGISPLTCTIFDPTYFGSILRNHVFHISPTRLKSSIMGKTYSTSFLKSHTGATQALTGARESWAVCQKSKFVHYYLFLFVLVFWHKANSACF